MRTIEFITALGDAINRIYGTNAYAGLDSLREHVQLVVASPNPGVGELFKWHPKRDLFRMKDVPFYGTWNRQLQEQHGIDERDVEPDRPRSDEVRFYPSPEDERFLEALRDGPPYIVFSLSASTVDRNIKDGIGCDASEACRERGFRVLRVGRTYQPQLHESFRPNDTVRHREPPVEGHWVVDAVDRLSAPGTIMAVHGAAGVFCAHSAISLAAFHVRKPTCVLLPERFHRYYTSCDDQFTFGRRFPENAYGEHKDYSRAFMDRWLDERAGGERGR